MTFGSSCFCHTYFHNINAGLFYVQVDLNDITTIDIAFDGVDEVDFNMNLLKVVLVHVR